MLALCRDHGLPAPQANAWLGAHEVDLYWADAGLALEFDGGEVHGTTQAFFEVAGVTGRSRRGVSRSRG